MVEQLHPTIQELQQPVRSFEKRMGIVDSMLFVTRGGREEPRRGGYIAYAPFVAFHPFADFFQHSELYSLEKYTELIKYETGGIIKFHIMMPIEFRIDFLKYCLEQVTIHDQRERTFIYQLMIHWKLKDPEYKGMIPPGEIFPDIVFYINNKDPKSVEPTITECGEILIILVEGFFSSRGIAPTSFDIDTPRFSHQLKHLVFVEVGDSDFKAILSHEILSILYLPETNYSLPRQLEEEKTVSQAKLLLEEERAYIKYASDHPQER